VSNDLKPLVLVDATNLAFRALFAHRKLQSSGQPTSILFGVLQSLLSIRKQVGDRIVFCWDHGVPGITTHRRKPWRLRYYKPYKATRRKDPSVVEEFRKQVPALRRILRRLGYQSVGIPGMEADDVIGLITANSAKPVVICSSDRDFYQLLRIGVTILHPGKWRLVTQSQVEREYGFSITRFPVFLSLGGDSSDNIRPMPGVGPRTAIRMVQAGVQPKRKHPEAAWLEKFPVLAQHWRAVRQTYKVCLIPTSPKDKRIVGYLDDKQDFDYSDYQRLPDNGKRMQEFLRFCGKYSLQYFVSIRRQFQ